MNGSPALAFFDAEQRRRAVLGVADLQTVTTGATTKTGPSSLVLFDKDGKVIWRAP
jgi:hypothetical protein